MRTGRRFWVHPLLGVLFLLALAGGRGKEAVLLLGILLSHELAHFLAASLAGLEVESLEIYPFGGVYRLRSRFSADPLLLGLVSLAGPLDNFFSSP